jgi:hypothetical protein
MRERRAGETGAQTCVSAERERRENRTANMRERSARKHG